MCNPRRVTIHVTRNIHEAWQQAVEQTATATGEVAETARINTAIRLDEEMGDLALQMFERTLAGEFAGFEAWQRDEAGRFHRRMDEVMLQYDPETHQLTVEAHLAESVTAEGRGIAEATGITTGEVGAAGEGGYFEDGWGGRTEERARAEAQQRAERLLNSEIEALHRRQHAGELAQAEAQARAEAEAHARAELARLQEERRQQLRERLQGILAQAEERVQHLMNRIVGESYRQALRQLVIENGGRVLADEQTGTVINMELELF